MSYANTPALDTTYTVQTQSSDGSWYWEAGEFAAEAGAHDLGGRMYGGTVPYRVVTIVRHVGEAVSSR